MWAKALALNTLAPEYQGQNNTEVTAQVGGEATFSCYTYHLSDDMVTWLKREDDQLLTVGQQVYVAEKRFSAVHSDHTEVSKRLEQLNAIYDSFAWVREDNLCASVANNEIPYILS
nr:uncharacterized protein LOC113823887 [Penaeus vannamei]